MQKYVDQLDSHQDGDAEVIGKAVDGVESHFATESPPSGGGGGIRTAVAWGLSGFVFGAAFWHLVGFWGFVEKIVYNGRPSDPSHYVAQSGPDCVALELDRAQGAVQKLPCLEDEPLLSELSVSARGDFLGQRNAPTARGPRPLRVTSGEQ